MIQTRLACSPAGAYKNVADMVVKVVQKEGPKALFGGLGPSLVGARSPAQRLEKQHACFPSDGLWQKDLLTASAVGAAGIIPFAGTQFFVYDGLRRAQQWLGNTRR